MVDLEPILKPEMFFLVVVSPPVFQVIPCYLFFLTARTNGGLRQTHYCEVLRFRESYKKLLFTYRTSDFFLLHGKLFSSSGTDQSKLKRS
jgi:hypothetical protein